jgi:hypothetical protein
MALDLDILKDKRANCYSIMLHMSVAEYLAIVEKTFAKKGGLEGQRDTLKTTTAIRIRKRMVQDLEAGTVLPPIVIGAILTGSDFDELEEIRSRDSFLTSIAQIDSDNIYIIDGMQRTSALREVLNSKDIGNTQIRIEYWIASQVNSLTYRMLVLNTGQVPWNLRRQLETIFKSIIKELTKKYPQVNIINIEENGRRLSPCHFQADKVIELFLVFGSRKEKIDLQDRLADEFTKQDFIESTSNHKFNDIFYEAIDLLARFDMVINKFENESLDGYFKKGIDLFSSHPACIGFITAISLAVLGRPGSDNSLEKQNDKWTKIKNDADQMLNKINTLDNIEVGSFLDFQTLNELIGKKSGRGKNVVEREFFLQSFKVLIEENFEIDSMTICWRSL